MPLPREGDLLLFLVLGREKSAVLWEKAAKNVTVLEDEDPYKGFGLTRVEGEFKTKGEMMKGAADAGTGKNITDDYQPFGDVSTNDPLYGKVRGQGFVDMSTGALVPVGMNKGTRPVHVNDFDRGEFTADAHLQPAWQGYSAAPKAKDLGAGTAGSVPADPSLGGSDKPSPVTVPDEPSWLSQNGYWAIPTGLVGGGLAAGGLLAYLQNRAQKKREEERTAELKMAFSIRGPRWTEGGKAKPLALESIPVPGSKAGKIPVPGVHPDQVAGRFKGPPAVSDFGAKPGTSPLAGEPKAPPAPGAEVAIDKPDVPDTWYDRNWPLLAGGVAGTAGLGGLMLWLRGRNKEKRPDEEKRADYLGRQWEGAQQSAADWIRANPERARNMVGDVAVNMFLTTPARMGLGAVIGAARAPSGYGMTGMARGAGYGLGAGVGAGLGTLTHNAFGDPEDLGPRLALQLAGTTAGLFGARALMGRDPAEIAKLKGELERRKERATIQQELKTASFGTQLPGPKVQGVKMPSLAAPKLPSPAKSFAGTQPVPSATSQLAAQTGQLSPGTGETQIMNGVAPSVPARVPLVGQTSQPTGMMKQNAGLPFGRRGPSMAPKLTNPIQPRQPAMGLGPKSPQFAGPGALRPPIVALEAGAAPGDLPFVNGQGPSGDARARIFGVGIGRNRQSLDASTPAGFAGTPPKYVGGEGGLRVHNPRPNGLTATLPAASGLRRGLEVDVTPGTAVGRGLDLIRRQPLVAAPVPLGVAGGGLLGKLLTDREPAVKQNADIRIFAKRAAGPLDWLNDKWEQGKGLVGGGLQSAGEQIGTGINRGVTGGANPTDFLGKGVNDFLDNNRWANYAMYGAPIGAGIGLVGGLFNRKKKKDALGDALTGGLLGGLTGAGAGLAHDAFWPKAPADQPAQEQPKPRPKAAALPAGSGLPGADLGGDKTRAVVQQTGQEMAGSPESVRGAEGAGRLNQSVNGLRFRDDAARAKAQPVQDYFDAVASGRQRAGVSGPFGADNPLGAWFNRTVLDNPTTAADRAGINNDIRAKFDAARAAAGGITRADLDEDWVTKKLRDTGATEDPTEVLRSGFPQDPATVETNSWLKSPAGRRGLELSAGAGAARGLGRLTGATQARPVMDETSTTAKRLVDTASGKLTNEPGRSWYNPRRLFQSNPPAPITGPDAATDALVKRVGEQLARTPGAAVPEEVIRATIGNTGPAAAGVKPTKLTSDELRVRQALSQVSKGALVPRTLGGRIADVAKLPFGVASPLNPKNLLFGSALGAGARYSGITPPDQTILEQLTRRGPGSMDWTDRAQNLPAATVSPGAAAGDALVRQLVAKGYAVNDAHELARKIIMNQSGAYAP